MKALFTKGLIPKPISPSNPWRDDRPGPDAYTHGVYNPVLRIGTGAKPKEIYPGDMPFAPPKKPRGTV